MRAYTVKDEQGNVSLFRGQQVLAMDNNAVELHDFNDRERSFLVTASVESEDRLGDIVMVDGWKTSDYMKNPVLLWSHQYQNPPVGRSLEVFKDEKQGIKRLMARVQVHSFNEQARLAYDLYKSKYLSGWSVGFLSLKSEAIIKVIPKQLGTYKDVEEEEFTMAARVKKATKERSPEVLKLVRKRRIERTTFKEEEEE